MFNEIALKSACKYMKMCSRTFGGIKHPLTKMEKEHKMNITRHSKKNTTERIKLSHVTWSSEMFISADGDGEGTWSLLSLKVQP